MESSDRLETVPSKDYSELQEKLKESERERKRLERELRTSERRNSAHKFNLEAQLDIAKVISKEKAKQEMYTNLLLRVFPDIIFVFGEKLEFLLGTDSIKKIIDIDDVAILHNRDITSIILRYNPPAFTSEIMLAIERAVTNAGLYGVGEASEKENIIEIHTGLSTYAVNIMPFDREDGSFAGLSVIMHDVTDLVQARAIAEKSSDAKSEFLSRMSHEIRTPMNAIIGMTDIARNADNTSKKDYCLDRISQASHHLLQLVNDILDMSKIEADKFEIYSHSFDFGRMIKNISELLSVRIEEKNQNLIIDIDKNIPQLIIGDELRINQVITNLLNNAIKFTPESGAVSLMAVIIDDKYRDILRVEVSDTGIGISQEQQSRLFNAFEQAESGTTRKFGGTGLGLAISKQIIEMMGGNIWIESELGNGAKFIFTFEFETIPEDQVSSNYLADDTLSDVYNFNGASVLVAEDVDINREIIGTVLGEAGIEVDFAENGLQALEKLKENPEKYNLILMDIQMPEMDGLEATSAIRALECQRAKDIPIIAMTANVFREDVERCTRAGMNSHLGKPIENKKLFKELALYIHS